MMTQLTDAYMRHRATLYSAKACRLVEAGPLLNGKIFFATAKKWIYVKFKKIGVIFQENAHGYEFPTKEIYA